MKTIIHTLLALLVSLATVATIAVFLPDSVQGQGGTGPRGEKFFDYTNALLAVPTQQDPDVSTRSCTKNGMFGLHNGVLYVCSAGVWNKITMATVTPTPTSTATATATNTPTPTP